MPLKPAGVRKALVDRLRAVDPRRRRLRRRVRRDLHGRTASIISSNCVGGRVSVLAGDPYRSPTAGLLFEPDSFFEFVGDLPGYLTAEVVEDPVESRRLGYPVGRIGPVTVEFMHYATFADAVAAWRSRAERVDLDDVVVVFVDDGAPANAARFAAIPYDRKVMLTTRTDLSSPDVLTVRGERGGPKIGDLYTGWNRLAPMLTHERLGLFRSRSGAQERRLRSGPRPGPWSDSL